MFLICVHGGRWISTRSSQSHDLHVVTTSISSVGLLGLHAEKFTIVHNCLR